MIRTRHSWWLGVLCALAIPASQGCFWSDDGIPRAEWRLEGATTNVQAWHRRVDYRIAISTTREGVASDAGDLFGTSAYLWFELRTTRGDVTVTRAGIARSDRLALDYEVMGASVSVQNALGECGRRPCDLELVFWAEIEGEGTVDGNGKLSIPYSANEDFTGWVTTEVVHLGNVPAVPP